MELYFRKLQHLGHTVAPALPVYSVCVRLRCNSQSKAVAHGNGILRGFECIVLIVLHNGNTAICNLALLLVQELSELLVCGRRNHERIAKLICLC